MTSWADQGSDRQHQYCGRLRHDLRAPAHGPLCDRFGAAAPTRGCWLSARFRSSRISFAESYEAFLFFRLCIGAIGASFVVTQFHTSTMFAPNVVGTANATAAGWGNAGGGATQVIMPLVVRGAASLGVEQHSGWRLAMFVPGMLMLVMAVAYYRYAKDTPVGNLTSRAFACRQPQRQQGLAALPRRRRDYRVWLLFVTYGACFGVELTIHNVAAIYYVDRFGLSLPTAGLYAGSFGLLALFARALGGIASDRIAHAHGLAGRDTTVVRADPRRRARPDRICAHGHARHAVIAMLGFGLFTHMACGATYALVAVHQSQQPWAAWPASSAPAVTSVRWRPAS